MIGNFLKVWGKVGKVERKILFKTKEPFAK
jgi:hypothetical protein